MEAEGLPASRAGVIVAFVLLVAGLIFFWWAACMIGVNRSNHTLETLESNYEVHGSDAVPTGVESSTAER